MKVYQYWAVGMAYICLATGSAPAQAQMYWQPAPPESSTMHSDHLSASDHGMAHGKRSLPSFILNDGHGAQASLIAADLSQHDMPLDAQQRLSLKPTGQSNYHVLVASRHEAKHHAFALRYIHMNGKPTGNSPSDLTMLSKADFELVPDPLPREHWRYESNEQARFQLRLHGEPVANHPVHIETSQATAITANTDAQGYINISIPDDITPKKTGRSNNLASEWRLLSNISAQGIRYDTALSAPYHVNPNVWSYLDWGIAAMLGGMAGGLALSTNLVRRQRNAAKKKEKNT